jgi:outer membrane protein
MGNNFAIKLMHIKLYIMKNAVLLILLSCFALNLNAQENDSNKDDYSKWQARFRFISILPSVDDNLDAANVEITNAFVPELDFTYFFTKNIAAELILGTAKHDVKLEGGADLGHVWLLPPTLNLQYHFYANDFKPYVGAGVNYTIFYGVDNGDVSNMEYDNSFGFSLQAGLDYNLNDKWFLNLDVKKLLLSTDVTVDTGSGILPVEVDINPFIVGFGVGMKF